MKSKVKKVSIYENILCNDTFLPIKFSDIISRRVILAVSALFLCIDAFV